MAQLDTDEDRKTYQKQPDQYLGTALQTGQVSAGQNSGPRFVYDPDMSPAERLQARKDQLQNYLEQEELRKKLANQQQVWDRIADSHTQPEPPKKTKEERIEELYREEIALQEKEDDLAREIRETEAIQEDFYAHQSRGRHLMETLVYAYPSDSSHFAQLQDDHYRAGVSLETGFEDRLDRLRKERRAASDKKDETYYARLRLANSAEGDDNEY